MVYDSRPPAGPMPILLSANRKLENFTPQIEILGMGLQGKISGLGLETIVNILFASTVCGYEL